MRDSKIFDTLEITDELKDYQQTVNLLDLEMNIISMYQAFYEQHKQKHGTFRHLKNPDYSQKMQERYNNIFCNINQTIEAKLQYHKRDSR